MSTVLLVALAVAVIALAAVAASGRLGELPETRADRDSFVLPDGPLAATDLARVRFGLGLRGYRMDEVDVVMDRLGAELAERDSRMAHFEVPG